jgi:hypothetical protein
VAKGFQTSDVENITNFKEVRPMPTVAEILKDHVTLEVKCIDRIYLNGYIPTLQTGGQLATFLIKHRVQRSNAGNAKMTLP